MMEKEKKKDSANKKNQQENEGKHQATSFEYSLPLYLQLLQEVASTENSILSVFPQLIESTTSLALRNILQEYQHQLEKQVDRLADLFVDLGESMAAMPSLPFEMLTAEVINIIEKYQGSPAGDAQLLAWLRKATHFQIACYSSLLQNRELPLFQIRMDSLEQTRSEKMALDAELNTLEDGSNLETV